MEEKEGAHVELKSGCIKDGDKQNMPLHPQDVTIDLKFQTVEGLLNKSKSQEIHVAANKDNILDNKHDISDLPKPRYLFSFLIPSLIKL